MKWRNKGHEFDATYEGIRKKHKLYLYGAGLYGQRVLDMIQKKCDGKFSVVGFIDSDSEKQGRQYCGLPVYAPKDLQIDRETTGVVISMMGVRISGDIDKLLTAMRLTKNIDYYPYSVFFAVFFAYERDLLFFPDISFIPSTYCNLRCEACLNFTPYIDKFEVREWEDLLKDVDVFFSCVDYIETFHVSGGEPLLYPRIADLLTYIFKNYGEQIYSLETVTNGTVIPPKDFLQVLHELPITITVDDYREALPEKAGIFAQVIAVLENTCSSGQGSYKVQKYDYWVDLAPHRTDNSSWSEPQLGEHFNACHASFQEYKGGKLYLCNYASFAVNAEIIPPLPPEDIYDLRRYNRSRLKELMEFRLGYSQRGYSEFCKKCAGMFSINPYRGVPGKQVERIQKRTGGKDYDAR